MMPAAASQWDCGWCGSSRGGPQGLHIAQTGRIRPHACSRLVLVQRGTSVTPEPGAQGMRTVHNTQSDLPYPEILQP